MSSFLGATSNLSSSSTVSQNLPGDSSFEGFTVEEYDSSVKTGRPVRKCHFFRNGDSYFKGVTLAFPPERYRTFESIVNEITRVLSKVVNLPTGVRNIFNLSGKKVLQLEDLENGKCYVVAGSGEVFKKLDYVGVRKCLRKPKTLQQTESLSLKQPIPLYICPRLITVIRSGIKPRKVIRLLINKKNAPSFDHTISTITQAVKLDTGPVLKVFSTDGVQIVHHEDFFKSEDIFFAFGVERPNRDDFEFDPEELKAISNIRRHNLPANIQLKNTYKRSDKSDSRGPLTALVKTKKKQQASLPLLPIDINLSHQFPAVIEQTYEIGPVIGEGNFAVVHRCKERKTNRTYALKVIDRSKYHGRESALESEVAILRILYHPNIVRLVTELFSGRHLYLVMEYAEGGDLFDYITVRKKFTEKEAVSMMKDLGGALQHIHSFNIVHRDIKPENLLISVITGGQKILKLGDFGLAVRVAGSLTTVCGTPTYVAPEILAEKGYGLKIDIWAAGVILYILLCGYPPFTSPIGDQEDLFDRILNGSYEFKSPYWDGISDLAKDLIMHMLQIQPELRFSAEDVMDHRWLVEAQLTEAVEELKIEDHAAGAVSR